MVKPQDIEKTETSAQTIETPRFYRFEEFQMDASEESLCRNGEKLRINRRTFQVLRLLVERAGTLVTKQEFFDTVWADAFVEDNSLTVTMTTLRKILGDDCKQPNFIENLPRKGYRFIADVKIVDESPIVPTDSPIEEKVLPAIEEKVSPAAIDRNESIFGNRKILVGICAAGLLLMLSVFGFNYFGTANLKTVSANQSQIESIAVLPFENQNADTEYLSDGLAESLINNLSALPNLRVISRNSVFQYKGKFVDSATIGRELNVRMVLTGRFIQYGDDLIVSAELTDLRDNKKIWERRYNPQVADALGLQQEISDDIYRILHKQLTGEDNSYQARRATDSPEAFQFYLKGRYHWNKRTDEDFRTAVEFFNQALEKDPTYALAYIGLANCYLIGNFEFTDTYPKRIAIVEATLQKALEIDDTLGEAYAALAINKCFYEWDFVNAEVEYKRAIELSPNYATAHHWYAELLAMEGRFDESFAEYQRALELDPLSLAINTDLGLTYYYARRTDLAIDHLEKLKKIDANYARTYLYLGQIYKGANMFEQSIAAYNKYSTISGDTLRTAKNLPDYIKKSEILADAFKKSGAKGYYKKLLEFALENKQFDSTQMAIIYAQLGERDKAFEFLESAYNDRSSLLVWLKVSPEFDNIRSDPRFSDLVSRVSLSQ